MTTIAVHHRQHQSSGLRPIQPSRDLASVADLIQVAFAGDLDRAGQAMLREMRSMSRMGPLLWWLDQQNAGASSLMLGFVWIEDNQIVGNVTINQSPTLNHRWVISNMAVAKNYQRRGIARQLMIAAMALARQRRGEIVNLQVRDDNPAALNLYRSMGFNGVFSTAYMRLEGKPKVEQLPIPVGTIRSRRFDHQDSQKAYRLARVATPESVQVEQPIKSSNFQLAFENRLTDWFRKLLRRNPPLRLVLETREHFKATLQAEMDTWRPESFIRMTVHPLVRGDVEKALVSCALRHLELSGNQTIRVQHPTYHPEGIEAFRAFGFQTDRTLLWMKCDL